MSFPDLGGPVAEVAARLLGCRLISEVGGRPVEAMLTEVEAYGGGEDPASHAYRGRTTRNASMFEGPGTLYVYRSYGIHWCANVVVGEPGEACAVLLRAATIEAGRSVAVARRGRADHLADGPGKLTQALGIDGEHDGVDLRDGPIRLEIGDLPSGWVVVSTPRVGISKAVELPWRFVAARG